uniref:Uncharacterized protein n=1 Tax=Heterorhabditis bacteriophora TaxID=37862 RepID=A0A1I7WGV2_HETBA
METTAISSEWARSVVARLWNDGNSLFDMSAMLRESISLGNPTANELQVLALEFLRAATVSSHPESRMIECLKMLAHAELSYIYIYISCIFLYTFHFFILFRWNRYKIVFDICAIIGLFKYRSVDFFLNFKYFCLIDHNNDADNKQSKEQLLRTFSIYINDSFIFRIMALASRRHAAIINSSIIQEIRSISSILSQKDIIYIELESKLSLIFEPLKFELQGISTGYKLVSTNLSVIVVNYYLNVLYYGLFV